MKFRLTSDSAGSILALECDKDDEFAYVDAERVQRGDLDSFLPFACWKGKKAYELAYRVGQLPSLAQVLSAPLPPERLRSILGSVLHMMHQCEENNLSRYRVAFDSPHVFYDLSADALRFAYVPMRSFVSPAGESSLLLQVCRVANVQGADGPFIAAIWDYACRTAILTSVGFESFLRDWGMEGNGSEARRTRHGGTAPCSDARMGYGWDFVEDERHEQRNPSDGEGFVLLEQVDRGLRFELGEGEHVVGRASACAIELAGCSSVSRMHARLMVRDGTCVVADLGSSNGVFVNGANIGPHGKSPLHDGDVVSFGEECFRISLH